MKNILGYLLALVLAIVLLVYTKTEKTTDKVTITTTTYEGCCMDTGKWFTQEDIKYNDIVETTIWYGKNSKKNRLQHSWTKNGKNYQEYLIWYESGQLSFYRYYDDQGRDDGERISFNEAGSVLTYDLYKHGKHIKSDVFGYLKEGESVICSEYFDGQYEECALMDQSRRTIKLKVWNEKGKLIKNIEFKENVK